MYIIGPATKQILSDGPLQITASLIGLTNSQIPLSFSTRISLISAPYCRSIPVESWLPTQIAASVIGPATKQILSDDPLQITASLIGLTNSRIPLSFST